ncbi:MAG: glycosyltransferase, partial [Candidatus Brocadiae bacterium]|nr:glycosyltransferase [Candidatus Brocadiia bacterium]
GMSLAKPVVASAVGGIPELVEDGVTGYLVPPRDPAAIAEALINVLKDRATAARMGMAARERVRSRFNVQRMVRETVAMMLGRPAEGRPSPSQVMR